MTKVQKWANSKLIGRLAGREKQAVPGEVSSFLGGHIKLTKFERVSAASLQEKVYFAWGTKTKGVDFWEGEFESPAGEILPDDSATVRFLFIAPTPNDSSPAVPDYGKIISSHINETEVRSDSEGEVKNEEKQRTSEEVSPTAIVIHLPATGEQTYSYRLDIPIFLAQEKGWCSLIVIAAFYGHRKPKDQPAHYISTVAGFVAQSIGIMLEASHLAAFMEKVFPSSVIAITGFSWGAAMSSCSGLLAAGMLEGHSHRNTNASSSHSSSSSSSSTTAATEEKKVRKGKLAVIPYVGSCSPSPIVDGILQGDINWQVLLEDAKKNGLPRVIEEDEEDHLQGEQQKGDEQEGEITGQMVRDRLMALMCSQHLRRFVDALKERRAKTRQAHSDSSLEEDEVAHIDSLVCVSALHDRFVPSSYTTEL
eukprot:TRINITY_DN2410_c0_g1_i2.p1 TRINITY_DN2410_c0_g1~~TRINITY_DN2410_c0_g1_i2.p1  ORF type:complete len:488 (-),score=117.90 TRINITY_DN2410_c0_g1_i2:182-1447(-)